MNARRLLQLKRRIQQTQKIKLDATERPRILKNAANINFTQDNFNHDIRPKLWGVKHRRLLIGTGPYKTYKRLMGTQLGIVFRAANCPPVIIAIAIVRQDIYSMMAKLKRNIHPDDFRLLRITKHEAHVEFSMPHVAKKHHRKQRRRKSLAGSHKNWWKKTPGTMGNLNPITVNCTVQP